MRNLLNLMEFSQDEVLELISLARAMKKNPADYGSWLKGKSVVTLFEKPSLRTRVTFDVGITRLGGHCIYMDQQNGAIGKRDCQGLRQEPLALVRRHCRKSVRSRHSPGACQIRDRSGNQRAVQPLPSLPDPR